MENRRRSSRQEWVEFSRLLGLRLQELRKHAGLTQTQVAKFLGKPGPGGKSWVCQLEKGSLREVSINNVVEFVWACRVDVEEITDVVDGYVKRPTIAEERVRQQVADIAAGLPLSKRARASTTTLSTGRRPAGARRWNSTTSAGCGRREVRLAQFAGNGDCTESGTTF
jgi:hypothetical protein